MMGAFLDEYCRKNMIKLNQSFKDKDEAIRYCGQVLLEAGCIDSGYIDAMIERNDSLSVYMGNFIAIPHGTDEAKALVKRLELQLFRYLAVLSLEQMMIRRLQQCFLELQVLATSI